MSELRALVVLLLLTSRISNKCVERVRALGLRMATLVEFGAEVLRVVGFPDFFRDLGDGHRTLLRVQRCQLYVILEHRVASAASREEHIPLLAF